MLTIASLPYCSLFVFTKWGVKVQINSMYPNIKISGIGAFREIICSDFHNENTAVTLQNHSVVIRRDVRFRSTKKEIACYWNSSKCNHTGPVRESNPGPLAPKARIMPLDQQAIAVRHSYILYYIKQIYPCSSVFLLELGVIISSVLNRDLQYKRDSSSHFCHTVTASTSH